VLNLRAVRLTAAQSVVKYTPVHFTHFFAKADVMTRTISLALYLSIWMGLGTVAIAQQEKKQQEQPPAPQPGPEHSHLKAQEGTWDCVCIYCRGWEEVEGRINKQDGVRWFMAGKRL
jgi:hypothetical protein